MENKEFKYDLSIGMIVKNEEKTLEACLQGLARLREEVNCQLIITDTGSTDRTIEIAEKYADTLLHFEWCNDFSKARNTGVDAAEGRWFMFIDADEVFDRSIIEIARFMKLPDRDSYDNATYIVRNINDDNNKRYSDFRAGRMFNFSEKKRHFMFTIHEAIPAEGNRYQIEAVALHSGYHKDIFDEKRVRNREILEKELEEEPNNIRFMKQIIDISKDEDEKMELAQKAIDLCKKQEAKNPEMIFSIYIFLAKTHITKENYQEALEACNDFFRIKMQDRKNLPTMEMAWISGTASMKLEDYEMALKKFLFYKETFEYLLKNPDNIFCSMGVYSTEKEVVYHQTCLNIVDCFEKYGNIEKAKQFMNILNCYKFKDNGEYTLLNAYLNRVLKLNSPELFERVLVFVNRVKLDLYSKEKFPTMLVAKMVFLNNITDFTQKCNKVIFSKICLLAFKSSDLAVELVYKHISQKNKFANTREQEFYVDMIRLYLLYLLDYLKNKEIADAKKLKEKSKSKTKSKPKETEDGYILFDLDSLDDDEICAYDQEDNDENYVKEVSNEIISKEQTNEVFELLIKHNYNFLSKSTDISKLKEQGINNIPKLQAMTIIIHDGLKDKNKNKDNYVECLKKAIPYSERHLESIKLAIELAN